MLQPEASRFVFAKIDIIFSQILRDSAFVLPNFFSDVFETSERFDTANAVVLGDGLE